MHDIMNNCIFCLTDGGKHVIDENGLHITQLDLRDTGLYECRAEVPSNGNARSRFISLDLLCKYTMHKKWLLFHGLLVFAYYAFLFLM